MLSHVMQMSGPLLHSAVTGDPHNLVFDLSPVLSIFVLTGLELNHHATHLSALIQGIWGVGRPRWPRATSFYTMHGPAGGVNF